MTQKPFASLRQKLLEEIAIARNESEFSISYSAPVIADQDVSASQYKTKKSSKPRSS